MSTHPCPSCKSTSITTDKPINGDISHLKPLSEEALTKMVQAPEGKDVSCMECGRIFFIGTPPEKSFWKRLFG